MNDVTDRPPLTPNAKFLHVFAVVRIDRFKDVLAHPEYGIQVVSVWYDENKASSEAVRLNGVNADKDAYYFHQLTRLERT